MIEFTKMQGLGNDFMVLDCTQGPFKLTSSDIQKLADRHFGVGFDQLLVLEKAKSKAVDFHYRIFNADGGEVSQCGNGARCLAKFIHEKGLSKKSEFVIETHQQQLKPYIETDGQVTVNMGIPQWDPEQIPFAAAKQQDSYKIDVSGQSLVIGVVNIGNPHAVLLVDNIKQAPIDQLGPKLESHSRFAEKVNVGFMQVVDQSTINLRVFERGVGETLACGSGACAAMVIGHRWSKLNELVSVNLPGGSLLIRWPGEQEPVYMTGPAETVYHGKIDSNSGLRELINRV